jgi:hypothetical protein
MAKKKSTKKEKLTENEKDELKLEGEIPKKSIRKREDRQLLWFFIIVGIVFASFLIPYFWVESEKTFEYVGADWAIEDYDNLRIYHGRFASLAGGNLMFNVFLRGDPRVNDIPTEGTFDKFKYGGVVSMTPEVDACRGELSRVMLDLGSFMRQGIGVDKLESGSTDRNVARETDRRFAECNTVSDRTLVIVEIGEPKVVQNESHNYCYTIYAEDCDDVSSVEKFIIKTIDDFGSVEK